MPALRTLQPLLLAAQMKLHAPLHIFGLLILVALADSEGMIKQALTHASEPYEI